MDECGACMIRPCLTDRYKNCIATDGIGKLITTVFVVICLSCPLGSFLCYFDNFFLAILIDFRRVLQIKIEFPNNVIVVGLSTSGPVLAPTVYQTICWFLPAELSPTNTSETRSSSVEKMKSITFVPLVGSCTIWERKLSCLKSSKLPHG